LSRTTGALVGRWHANVNGAVKAIAVFDQHVFIGGSFTQVNGVARAHLTALRLSDGRLAAAPNIKVDGPVLSPLAMRDRLYVVGAFHELVGLPRRFLGRITVKGRVTSWRPAPDHLRRTASATAPGDGTSTPPVRSRRSRWTAAGCCWAGTSRRLAGHLRPMFAERSTATGAVLAPRVSESGPRYRASSTSTGTTASPCGAVPSRRSTGSTGWPR
jgi:hypothetical protein